MKEMYQKIIFILSLTIFVFSCKKEDITPSTSVSCTLNTNSSSKTHPKSAAFQALLDEYTKKGLPGFNLYVKDSKGLFIGSSGMADIEKNIPFQACHVSKAASVTKIFLAVALMKLQEEGTLKLDDPISKYIDEDKLSRISNCDKPLTIKNLMEHTSGIYDVISNQGFYLQVLNNPSRHWSADNLLQFVYGKKAMFEFNPATTAEYSNTNYLLLSMIIEKATGKSHSEVLHEKVIDKLNLTNTYYHWHDALPSDRVAQGYFDLYHNNSLVNLSNWNTGSGNGYGGLYSTVEDLAKFIEALYGDKTLVSQNSIDQMLVFHPTIENRKHLGVGCYKDFIDIGNPEKDYAYGHRGRDLAYTADLNYFPIHKATMALMCNYGTDSDSDLKDIYVEFRDKVAKLIVE